jgi:hypothetical protein
MAKRLLMVTCIALLVACSDESTDKNPDGGSNIDGGVQGDGLPSGDGPTSGGDGSVKTEGGGPPPKVTCESEGGTAAVQKPQFVKNIQGTGCLCCRGGPGWRRKQ